MRNLVNSARRVEGISRHASTHAAGVVISKEPLTKYVPLQRGAKADSQEAVMTQFSMDDIARIGLLKMDFLGLANLTILGKAREIIQQNHGIDIDLYKLPMDDKKTFDLLSSGETAGVFQLEGAGMRRYIKELKPTTFSDIAAMVALYRPGPMEHIPTFIDAKHGRKPIQYPHPALENILKETYGVIVYQEQVLFIVQALAGYSLGQADIFRKAMGKKIAEVMKKEKRNFLAGAKKKEFSAEVAEAGLRPHRAFRRLCLQQGARLQLCPHRLPDRLSQGELPGGVYHRLPDHPRRRAGENRQRRRRVPPPGHHRAAAGYQPQPGRFLHRR